MIYFDNAATTFPKPESVRRAVNQAIVNYGANPGRSGHKLAMKSSEIIYRCRSKAASFFGDDNPADVIFTLNCTHSINIVLKGLLSEGDHVVVSDLEHNAVMRPLQALKNKKNVSYTIANVSNKSDEETLNNFRDALQENTKLVVCTHVSNVWGIKLPVERITAMCHQYGIYVLIDAAQSAGLLDINSKQNKYDFVCTAGHKGLYGPMGTGLLITPHHNLLDTFMEGGTGSGSEFFEQPAEPPDKFESGTPNLIGIAGLSAGFDFLNAVGIKQIELHEMRLLTALYDRLSYNKKIILYTERPTSGKCGGVISFNVKNIDSETAAEYLNKNYSVAVRAGLHCSPLAHKHFGTEEVGAVRIAPSYFNTMKEIDLLARALTQI